METHGRITIYANYREKELLQSLDNQKAIIIDILKNSVDIHKQNSAETEYLHDYLYGIQDIRFKEKSTRTDINHRNVENWAFACMDWKKTFLLGKPIKYAPVTDVATEEIEELNKYFVFENKQLLDQEIYEDIFTCGRGFRYNFGDKVTEDDETPFETLNLDVKNTEVVYSSSINHEQLLTYIETSKKYIYTDDQGKQEERYYDEYDVYTRNYHFVVNNKMGNYLFVGNPEPLVFNTHIVTEYYINKRRMGWLEIGKDLFNAINYVQNLDLDDMEGFVNSIMVFTNAEIDKDGMDAIKEYGAVSISSTDNKKASVEILQSRLQALDTQLYYARLLNSLHAILSIPEASSNGQISNAETGKAVLTGQGFTSATIRVEGEEQAFKKCDRISLQTVLKICKNSSSSKIKTLKVSDIESKFNRDLSDNLLVKTQALINLQTANIPPEIRNQVIGLFSDPTSVTRLEENYEKMLEEKAKVQQQINKINEQNNKTIKTLEQDNQQQ